MKKADSSIKFGSYPEGWFALEPITERIKAPKEWGTTKLFERTQTPLVPRFAKSDYKVNIELYGALTHKVQGSTMESGFIADIARPPTGRMGLQNLYVILSRATSFDKLAILRPFDDKVFVEDPDDNLDALETRLEEKNQEVQSQYEHGRGNT